MKIYLDNCAIQRPLDEKNQVRIALEAEAVLGVISLCEQNVIELISSDVLLFEISNTPNMTRREYAQELLKKSSIYIKISKTIEKRAKEFEKIGIHSLDALHLASAEKGNADYFCTCDDKFLKKMNKITDLKIKVGTPIHLIEEIEQ